MVWLLWPQPHNNLTKQVGESWPKVDKQLKTWLELGKHSRSWSNSSQLDPSWAKRVAKWYQTQGRLKTWPDLTRVGSTVWSWTTQAWYINFQQIKTQYFWPIILTWLMRPLSFLHCKNEKKIIHEQNYYTAGHWFHNRTSKLLYSRAGQRLPSTYQLLNLVTCWILSATEHWRRLKYTDNTIHVVMLDTVVCGLVVRVLVSESHQTQHIRHSWEKCHSETCSRVNPCCEGDWGEETVCKLLIGLSTWSGMLLRCHICITLSSAL